MKPSDASKFIPYLLIALGIGVAGVGGWKWNQKRHEVFFSGQPQAGSYGEIVADFSCAGRKQLRGHLEIRDGKATLATTNSRDCTETTATLKIEELEPVGFDGNHVAYHGAIFQKFTTLPNLMDGTPEYSAIWCRTTPEREPAFDLYVDRNGETQTVRMQKAVRKGDHQLVEAPLELAAQVKQEHDMTTVTAEGIEVRIQGDKAQAEFNSDNVKTNVNLNCLTEGAGLHRCPAGYAKHADVCIQETPLAAVATRLDAVNSCTKLGKGFSLLRREDWPEAPANEWTRETGFAPEPASNQAFRCSFREKPLQNETIFPDSLKPNQESAAGQPLEVGVKFRANMSGFVKAIRFYRSQRDAAGYTVHLWDSKGMALATTTGTGTSTAASSGTSTAAGARSNETSGAGWQSISLSEPVAIAADQIYTASYYAAAGKVSELTPALQIETGRGLSLVALAGGGVSITNGGFPSQVAKDTNFMVDIVFEPVR